MSDVNSWLVSGPLILVVSKADYDALAAEAELIAGESRRILVGRESK